MAQQGALEQNPPHAESRQVTIPMNRDTEIPIPYLPSVEWYRDYTAFRLGTASAPPRLPAHFCRAEVEAPFGRRTLSVPVEGGRRLISARRYPLLRLSEHGNWRRTHWSTIATAYGPTPFFHLYEEEFAAIYDHPHETLAGLCRELHETIDHAASLSENIDWLLRHPDEGKVRPPRPDCDPTLSILHLLFQEGPSTIFSLLPDQDAKQ